MTTERITKLNVHDLTEREILILRQETGDRSKNPATAWILWFVLGVLFIHGAHRFYLGRIGSGIGMLLTLGGVFVWWIIDAFLMAGMIKANRRNVEKEILDEIAAMRESQRAKS